jgi:hypothetical protein
MIPLTKIKILLGTEAIGLSDEELKQVRAEMYQLADLGIDQFLKDKSLDTKI